MNRVSNILGHMASASPSKGSASSSSVSGASSADDVVIVSALRTAIGRAKKGSFKDTHPADLLAGAIKGVLTATGIAPGLVEEVCIGNVLAPGAFATQARMAAFMAGIPDTSAVSTCNRQCSSGLQAVAHIAAAIKSGFIEVGMAGGVESMSLTPMGPASVGDLSSNAFEFQQAADCLTPMGTTSENVAERFGVTRADQDGMAVESHRRSLNAQAHGYFDREIIPMTVQISDKDGNEKTITVTKDDGPRKGTTKEGLGKLRTVFKKDGTTTAGNASQVSDGAACVLLMKRSKARALGLKILGRFAAFAVKGVAPDVMGIGPAVAIPAALAQANLSTKDVDVYEINEAFASQAVYCCRKLGLDMARVNPNGGAISLGHPLGCTGARMVATLLNQLEREGKKTGVISMCIGTGMGAAAVIIRD